MPWISEGVKTGVNAAGTLLADMGPAAGDGDYTPQFLFSANFIGVFTVEKRNAANNATLQEWVFVVNGSTLPFHFANCPIPILLNERIRVTLRVASIAGNAMQVSMCV